MYDMSVHVVLKILNVSHRYPPPLYPVLESNNVKMNVNTSGIDDFTCVFCVS